MTVEQLIELFRTSPPCEELTALLLSSSQPGNGSRHRVHLKGATGSGLSIFIASAARSYPSTHLVVLNDKEEAAYIFNDIESLLENHRIFFFPTSYRKTYSPQEPDIGNMQIRTEVIASLSLQEKNTVVITYPEALCEKTIARKTLEEHTLKFSVNASMSFERVHELLHESGFEMHDFVFQPGQFAIRGGIVDLFSFSEENPFRIEFNGDCIRSIRVFDASTQLSLKKREDASVVADPNRFALPGCFQSLCDYLPPDAVIWFKNIRLAGDKIEFEKESRGEEYNPEKYFSRNDFFLAIDKFHTIECAGQSYFDTPVIIALDTQPQPSFNKNFELLKENLIINSTTGYQNLLVSDSAKQISRLYSIFEDILHHDKKEPEASDLFSTLLLPLYEGFIDRNLKIACYTDHQIFNRYHRYRLREGFQKTRQALMVNELNNLKPGDYVVHIDHGIGQFGGLEKIVVNGKEQETIRIVYKDNDILYVSIHSLHRISKYSSKEGSTPKLDKLGSNAWKNLKQKTKNRVKELAFDLIKLYARRKSEKGFSFSPDTYMQTELEASFIYEDTPDQIKSTADVKQDMESESPMDRLVCGDVGFGKTEIAVRAAFKAVADNKQVAVLVPTTILTLQHYKTFSERLNGFPCSVEYINRFKKQKEQKECLRRLEDGRTAIVIGTHRLLGKDVQFKDIGLLIIDEEQKFGVGAKDILKNKKTHIDTLTLTATPIPRTMQLSMMGARDLSIINTPPPNRYPVQTEVHTFNERVIRDSVVYEIDRGGQVFFIHNRIHNIQEVAELILRLCPALRIAVAHGQMPGNRLEQIMLDFIEGQYDLLVSTTIIESGIDIPNVNTIIINDAHRFGLSDLHQLRGRVGRSNRRAFCYLLTPPLVSVSDESRKRLKAIEDFSDLGSGFNIALRDLDIRGAGNLLGAEQSGYINDIGFETYHKILDEAVRELKEEMAVADLPLPHPSLPPLPPQMGGEPLHPYLGAGGQESTYSNDCQIDTDMELLIPDDYVNPITERLSLYKELSDIENESALSDFAKKLTDRFGPIPPQTDDLFNIIRLRWIGKKTAFEKILLKNKRFTGYFPSNPSSPFYRSKLFDTVMVYVQNKKNTILKEKNGKLSLTIEPVITLKQAIEIIHEINRQ